MAYGFVGRLVGYRSRRQGRQISFSFWVWFTAWCQSREEAGRGRDGRIRTNTRYPKWEWEARDYRWSRSSSWIESVRDSRVSRLELDRLGRMDRRRYFAMGPISLALTHSSSLVCQSRWMENNEEVSERGEDFGKNQDEMMGICKICM